MSRAAAVSFTFENAHPSVLSTPSDVCVAKEMNLARYKYVVQVVIGEQRGEGVRMGSRCFWDSETDNVASETYINVRARASECKLQSYNQSGNIDKRDRSVQPKYVFWS